MKLDNLSINLSNLCSYHFQRDETRLSVKQKKKVTEKSNCWNSNRHTDNHHAAFHWDKLACCGFFLLTSTSSLDSTQGEEYSLLRVELCQNIPRTRIKGETTFMCFVVCDNYPVDFFCVIRRDFPESWNLVLGFQLFLMFKKTGWNYSCAFTLWSPSWQMLKEEISSSPSGFPFPCTHRTFTNKHFYSLIQKKCGFFGLLLRLSDRLVEYISLLKHLMRARGSKEQQSVGGR